MSFRTRTTVGLFYIGLETYWDQFPNLRPRLVGYGAFVSQKLSDLGAEVVDQGMVDNYHTAVKASEEFAKQDVDLIVCYVTTYATSSQVLPVVQRLNKPVIVLNLQPTAQLNYLRTGTAEWLANCQACCVPEIACAFARCGIPFATITGLLGLNTQTVGALADEVTFRHPAAINAWVEMERWLAAVSVKRALSRSRIGFLGHTYPGMLDMYSDFTQVTGQFGCHIEVLEMDDLESRVHKVTSGQVKAKESEVLGLFDISEDSPSDPLAKKPGADALDWSFRVASGLDMLAADFELDALAYYYRGVDDNTYERLGANLIVGCSLLTQKSIPCSGEGDLKNAIAMKIMDLLETGGSFTELYAIDFLENFILMGHDGPFHAGIAQTRPILRGLSIYHGKSGDGVSVEAQVRYGEVTILGITQTLDGKMKMICSEGWSLPGECLRIGNTNSRLKFTKDAEAPFDVSAWMNQWACEAPTHHVALGVGHIASTLKIVAGLLDMPFKLI